MSNSSELFHSLLPGTSIKGDWCDFPVPRNIEVGENTVFDTSSCFKKFFSTLEIGLRIGRNVTLQGPTLATEHQAYLEIGDFSFISSAIVAASKSIIIGKYVYIAGGVTIVDTDFHPLNPAERLTDTVAISTIGDKSRRPKFDSAPVLIEDDVWIGFNATILKGVTIGKGSIVQPGAVVLKDVPELSIVSGNPAVIERYEYE